MMKNNIMIRVYILSLSIEKEFQIPDTFTVEESIDAVINLLLQEYPSLKVKESLDFYIENNGFLDRKMQLKQVIQHPSERIYLL